MKTALILIDIQEALVTSSPYNLEEFIETVNASLALAKENGWEVICLRHCDAELVPGSEAWQVSTRLNLPDRVKYLDKEFNSIFKETGLADYLGQHSITRLVLVGMQTEYCIDTSCKVAFELGYEVVIPRQGHTTFSTEHLSAKQIIEHYQTIWDGRFANLVSLEDLQRLN